MTVKFEGFIGSFLTKAAQKPNQNFALFNNEPITFAAVDKQSAALATYLRARGLKHGNRVAVMMKNSELALPVLFGLARAGIVWVPVNTQQRGEGLRYILEHSEPAAVICDSEFRENIRESGAEIPADAFILASGDGSLRNIVQGASRFTEAPPAASDLFSIMYTSGTTGRPKGVLVTHGMMRLAGEAVRQLTMARPGDLFFVWEPLYHIGGAQLIVVPTLEDVTLAMVDRFSASRFWAQVRECGATHMHYLGGILQILLKQPENAADRDHRVRIAWGAGCTKEVWPLFRDRFGVQIRECYGMTEASSVTSCNIDNVIGAIGKPMPWLSVDIIDEHGRPVDTGEKGEIVVRSSIQGALFQGYLRNPEASQKALRDEALHTGDIGSYDADGNLWFHGRLTDSVRCKGENVSAWEVEHIVGKHPLLEDCAMIGVAAEIGEQDIMLFVKPKKGNQVDPAALSAWLTSRLASYQNPRYIAVVDEFERTPSQRVMKHKLSKDIENCWDRLRPITKHKHDSTVFPEQGIKS